ncbi:hypothetical protein JTB14_019712 [Gonioctena quinquepunctata]|nr:hypothetical protein JTB14_019712 [Gonioctena quinquepunctata]
MDHAWKGGARAVTYRLMQGPSPIIKLLETEYQRLEKELRADTTTGMPSDAMITEYNFNGKYEKKENTGREKTHQRSINLKTEEGEEQKPRIISQ